MTELFKKYIELSTAFRKTEASSQNVENLYDLFYMLKEKTRNDEENLIFSNICTLLGYHLWAYEAFSAVADLKKPKEASKLHVLQQKAQSHNNNFIIKDLRKERIKKTAPKPSLADFSLSAEDENTFLLTGKKEVIIFNQIVHRTDFEVFVHEAFSFEEEFSLFGLACRWQGRINFFL